MKVEKTCTYEKVGTCFLLYFYKLIPLRNYGSGNLKKNLVINAYDTTINDGDLLSFVGV